MILIGFSERFSNIPAERSSDLPQAFAERIRFYRARKPVRVFVINCRNRPCAHFMTRERIIQDVPTLNIEQRRTGRTHFDQLP